MSRKNKSKIYVLSFSPPIKKNLYKNYQKSSVANMGWEVFTGLLNNLKI